MAPGPGVPRVAIDLGAPAPGTEGGFGTSISMGITYHLAIRGRNLTLPVNFYLDGLAFGVGRAAISLSTISFRHPFPAALESHLYSLLTSRAAAAQRYPALQD